MKSKLFKKIVSMFLVSIFILATCIPASAQEKAKTPDKAQVVYTDESNGNQVAELTKENDEKVYVVVAKGQKINDLSDETKLKDLASKSINKEVIGERWYLAFADDLEQAKDIAKKDASLPKNTTGNYSVQASYFWGHGSYVESYWDYSTGWGKHVKLVPVDRTFVQDTGLAVCALLGAALVATGVMTAFAAAVVCGAIAYIIVYRLWSEGNSDGSFDLYSPDSLRNDHNPVYNGDYLGRYKTGMGNWLNIYWPGSTYQL